MVDMGLGLRYRDRYNDTEWDASQTHWRVDLLYRWTPGHEYLPTLVFKLGLGGTISTVESHATGVIDAVYLAPYLGADACWMIWDPVLRFVLSPSIMIVSAGGDLDALGLGINFFTGLEAVLADLLRLGIGYDLTHYGFDDDTGSTSDTYHGLFVQVGYEYR